MKNRLATCLALALLPCGLAMSGAARADVLPPYQYKVLAPVGRGFPLCDHVYGVLLNMKNDHYLTYGAGEAQEKPNRGDNTDAPDFSIDPALTEPSWTRMEWTDFRAAKPQLSYEMTTAGLIYGRNYGVSRTHVDIEGGGHRSEIYRIRYTDNSKYNQLLLDKDDEGTAMAPHFYALQPSYVFFYEGKPYFMKRDKGWAEVYQLFTDRAHKPPGGNISTTMLCRFTANISGEGSSTQEITTTVPNAGAVYHDGTKK